MTKIIIFLCLVLATKIAFSDDKIEFDSNPNSGKNKRQRINDQSEAIAEIINQLAEIRSEIEILKKQVQAKGGAKSGESIQFTPPEE